LIRSRGIGSIQLHEVKAQELVLILPFLLTGCESFTVCWGRWRVGDLGDQIRSRSFSDPIDEDAQQRDSQEDVEADTEPEQETFSIVEPMFLLLFRKMYAGEVGFEL
jgi:hypothetical protein